MQHCNARQIGKDYLRRQLKEHLGNRNAGCENRHIGSDFKKVCFVFLIKSSVWESFA